MYEWIADHTPRRLRSRISKVLSFARGFSSYYLEPETRSSWGGAFNGQSIRQQIFRDLLAAIKFTAIAETGTYRGTTTEFLYGVARLPVYTVEIQRDWYGYSVSRFLFNRKVHVSFGDSRTFLRDFVARHKGPVFFYLDAHWGPDLPLREEVGIIFANCEQAVVMIDDFQVPNDEGYGYDNYGVGKALCRDYLSAEIKRFQLDVFFPATHSEKETGAKRGCVVLATALADRVRSVSGLQHEIANEFSKKTA